MMKILNYISRNWGILFYLFVSIFAVLPFFNSGFFNIHDNTQVERIYQMSIALKDGMFPVRWVPDLGYGYGYAIFNYYSVLPYYIGGALVILGVNALLATKILFSTALIGAGISMYFLARRYFGNIAGVVAATIYLYFPYHAVNTYVRGDLAELFAYIFLPLVFLGLFEIYARVKKDKITNGPIALTSLSIAFVVLSHNLTAFILFLFVGLFMLVSFFIEKRKKRLFINYSLVLFIAFLLSSFYSIPAVLEMAYSNVVSVVGGGAHYEDHFVCLPQLWNSIWGFGGSAPGCLDGMSFKLGKLNIVLALIAFMVLLFNIKKTKKLLIISIAFAFLALSVFMTLEFSLVLWRLPFMDFLQFPWRFLNFTGLFISFVAAYLVGTVLKIYSYKFTLILASLIMGFTIYFNQGLFQPQAIDEKTSDEYTKKENITWTVSKISDEYLPGSFTAPASREDVPTDKLIVFYGDGEIEMLRESTNHISANVNMASAGQLKVNIAYFPAWQIFLNNKHTSYVIRNNGLLVNVPKGMSTIDIRFVQTPIEKAANALSLIGVLAFSVVIIGKPKKIWRNLNGE